MPNAHSQIHFTNTFPSCRHLVTSASELLPHHRTRAPNGSLVRHLVASRSNENVIFQDAYYYHRQDTSPPRLRPPLRSLYSTRQACIAFPRCFPSLLFGCSWLSLVNIHLSLATEYCFFHAFTIYPFHCSISYFCKLRLNKSILYSVVLPSCLRTLF